MDRELLRISARDFGLTLTEGQLNSFALFYDELVRWNKSINLTSMKNDVDITVKHFVDSLSLSPLLGQGVSILDIGSGAGFPAIPLAISRPDLKITTIDSVNKKILFQKHVARLIGIQSVEALHGRVEVLSDTRSGLYPFVTSRAFSSLMVSLEMAKPFLSEKGKVICMRGPEGAQDVQEASNEIIAAGFCIEQMLKYELPLKMGQRCLIIAGKAA